MKIIITGATGFVGSVLIPKLIAKYGYSDLSLFVLESEYNKINNEWLHNGINVIIGDITDKESVSNAIMGHTHVIHSAGLISYWKRDKALLYKVNVEGVRNVVEACLKHNIERLLHISSVGAIGYNKDKSLANEKTDYNWHTGLYYMSSKHEGQLIVERAIKENGLKAIILNPASILGPGDCTLSTPNNQLYYTIYKKFLIGTFAGGLAVVDVRDLTDIIIKCLNEGEIGEKYLLVGDNVLYREITRLIAKNAGRKILNLPVPGFILTAAGIILELISDLTKRKPLLTKSYGIVSGLHNYYSNDKAVKTFNHKFIGIEKMLKDGCEFFENTFLKI